MKIQSQSEVTINAPLKTVWDFCLDISKIPEFHPRVSRVDYLSDSKIKEEGVSYQCNITEGKTKGSCVEKVVKIIPFEKFVTSLPEDSWGISKLFENYTVDTVFETIDDKKTRLCIIHYYELKKLKAKLLNLLARKKIARQTLYTLKGIKKMVEKEFEKTILEKPLL